MDLSDCPSALDGAVTLAVDFYYPKVGAAACVARLGVRPTEKEEEEEDSVSHNVTPTDASANAAAAATRNEITSLAQSPVRSPFQFAPLAVLSLLRGGFALEVAVPHVK